jgi:hypothetical protein
MEISNTILGIKEECSFWGCAASHYPGGVVFADQIDEALPGF